METRVATKTPCLLSRGGSHIWWIMDQSSAGQGTGKEGTGGGRCLATRATSSRCSGVEDVAKKQSTNNASRPLDKAGWEAPAPRYKWRGEGPRSVTALLPGPKSRGLGRLHLPKRKNSFPSGVDDECILEAYSTILAVFFCFPWILAKPSHHSFRLGRPPYQYPGHGARSSLTLV